MKYYFRKKLSAVIVFKDFLIGKVISVSLWSHFQFLINKNNKYKKLKII